MNVFIELENMYHFTIEMSKNIHKPTCHVVCYSACNAMNPQNESRIIIVASLNHAADRIGKGYIA